MIKLAIIKNTTVIACILLFLFSAQSFLAIRSTSATFDEGQNYGIGKYLLETRKWDIMGCILSPPLSYYVSSLPLFLAHENQKVWRYEQAERDLNFLASVDILRAHELLSAPENNNDRLLILSRCTILFFGLILGYYVFRFSRELHGDTGGLLSLLLFAFCPNMLAFSGIINSDLLFCALSFIACYYFWHFLKKPTLKTTFYASITSGLALTTKLNAVLLLLYFLYVYLIHCFSKRIYSTTRLFIIFALAAFILLFSYGFNLTPYLQGFQLRMLQLDAGFKSYFCGSYSISGWWYFYPFVLLVKTPLPLLILFFATLLYYLRAWRAKWFEALFLLSPIIFFILLFSTSKISAGVRYLLPVYPFMFVAIGTLANQNQKIIRLIAPLTLWYICSSLFIMPHYLSYFNELVGGPDKAYKYLVDSNLDWGQDLKGLKKYMDAHGIQKISLSYFGTDTPQRYGIEYDWLPSYYLVNPEPDKIDTTPRTRYVAISATNLQGVYLEPHNTFAWFRQFEPVAKIGYSIFIYDLSKLPPIIR
ncbi:MAG: glycosyltransferase family 39 protein [Geobacteraceae bacterium]|nr:glycosyltransferase family 39 protein [Geobacteraceae bacterium]